MWLDAPESINHTSEFSFLDSPVIKYEFALLSDPKALFSFSFWLYRSDIFCSLFSVDQISDKNSIHFVDLSYIFHWKLSLLFPVTNFVCWKFYVFDDHL